VQPQPVRTTLSRPPSAPRCSLPFRAKVAFPQREWLPRRGYAAHTIGTTLQTKTTRLSRSASIRACRESDSESGPHPRGNEHDRFEPPCPPDQSRPPHFAGPRLTGGFAWDASQANERLVMAEILGPARRSGVNDAACGNVKTVRFGKGYCLPRYP
jgi:hypothetical protein